MGLRENILRILREARVPRNERIQLYKDENIIVVVPLTHEALKKYAHKCQWCINDDRLEWEGYHRGSMIIIQRNPKKPKMGITGHPIPSEIFIMGRWDEGGYKFKDVCDILGYNFKDDIEMSDYYVTVTNDINNFATNIVYYDQVNGIYDQEDNFLWNYGYEISDIPNVTPEVIKIMNEFELPDNLSESILRENDNKIPNYVLRQLQPQNFLNELKRSMIYNYKYYDLDSCVDYAAEDVAYFVLSKWDNEDIPSGVFDEWAKELRTFFTNKYGDELKEYIKKVYSSDNNEYDGYKYIFVKHSERDWKSKKTNMWLSDSFYKWQNLIEKKGPILPIDWWRVKDELDKIGNGEILIKRPEDEGSKGYYFTIVKELRQDEESNGNYKRLEIKL